jgi:TonB family protein
LFAFSTAAAASSSRSFSVSMVAHCAGAIVLLTIPFVPPIQAVFPNHYLHFTMLAPNMTATAQPVLKQPLKVRVPPPREPVAREFHAPLAVPRTTPLIMQSAAIPVADVGDIPLALLAPAESPRTLLATAPVPVSIKLAGFSGIELSARPSSPRATLAGKGAFDSAGAGAPATPHLRAMAPGGFGDATVLLNNAPATRKLGAQPDASPVEILFKPRPIYTAEARRLQIEGEVLLEIRFSAAGEIRIVRVIQGLGHGLDESAEAAAREIRFRPAERASTPVDSTAVVHIRFQLAY